MAKVIIIIHGLRNKPPKDILLKWGQLSILEGIKHLSAEVKLPKVELVYWADILHSQPLSLDEKDKNSPYFIDEVYVPSKKIKKTHNHSFRKKIRLLFKKIIYAIFLRDDFSLRFRKISQKFIHDNFNALEVYFNENCDGYDSGCGQRHQINNRLITLLEIYKNDDIFLVAHSMGSIISFDVLSFLAPNININTFATIGSPLGAPFVLSRINRLSNLKIKDYIKLQTPESVFNNWYNFADIKDSIPMDYKLSEEFSENSKGVKVQDFLVENTYKTNGKSNHHKSFGYLRTPEFTEVLIKFINAT